MTAFNSFDELLRFAIAHRRLVRLRYHGNVRVAEPHDYGVLKRIERLFVYQLSSVRRVPGQRVVGWRLLDVAKIEGCDVLDDHFQGSRRQSHRHHHVWDVVYARVE